MSLSAEPPFKLAVDAACALLALPAGLIENVSDGTNAYLVAIDDGGAFLRSEAAIVERGKRSAVRELFLIAAPLTAAEEEAIRHEDFARAAGALEARRAATLRHTQVH